MYKQTSFGVMFGIGEKKVVLHSSHLQLIDTDPGCSREQYSEGRSQGGQFSSIAGSKRRNQSGNRL